MEGSGGGLMATKAPKTGRIKPFTGPWRGVLDVPESYGSDPRYLRTLKNCYLADPPNDSNVFARPGWRRLNGGVPVYAPATPFRGQMVYSHELLDGSTLNFLVIGGKLFRVNQELTSFEDVTPVGVTVDSAITTRVFGTSLIGTLAFTDGVNRMWVATNLTSTPITGTYINYDGAGVAWNTFGAPWVYGGAAFAILRTVNSVARRADVSWCNPGTLSVGWQQTDYDNNWTLSQNNSGPLFALAASNVALYYFRLSSIGTAQGDVGPDLASTATEDAIAFNVGTQCAQSIVKFGNAFYFVDALGRPYLFNPGEPPRDIWKQLRSVVTRSTTAYPLTTAIVATAAIERTLNFYLVAPWSTDPGTQAPPNRIEVFDAPSGTYLGWWTVGEDEGIDCLGEFVDSAGRSTVIAITSGGYVWAFSALTPTPEFITTEAGVLISLEDLTSLLTTEGQAAVFTDDDVVPERYLTTNPFGESDDIVLNVDQVTVSTLVDTPCRVTTVASGTSEQVEGIPEPSASQNGSYRLAVGCTVAGRGPTVTVTPLDADEQWIAERVSMVAVASLAGPEDS